MEIEQLPLAGAMIVVPRIFSDERGSFTEVYSLDRYRRCGIDAEFVQDNVSRSRVGVLRGLHGSAQMAKLVGVLSGSAFDVIVDARATSPTHGKWFGTTLDARGGRQIYIPTGFLHGFLALEDDTIFAYKQSAPYDPALEIGVAWDDPALGIEWPLGGRRPILSQRDAANPPLASLRQA